jgi:hypothetical protein
MGTPIPRNTPLSCQTRRWGPVRIVKTFCIWEIKPLWVVVASFEVSKLQQTLLAIKLRFLETPTAISSTAHPYGAHCQSVSPAAALTT